MNRHMYFRQQEKNYLMHHGIKGQKWGIRRYQNPDGTLTEEGRRRYGLSVKEENKYENANLNKRAKGLKKETKHLFNKLSDAQVGIAEELAETREYEDKKKWANNKEFKKDIKEAAEAYDKIDDWSTASEFEEDIRRSLKTKYPGAEKLLDGLQFGENNWIPLEKRFNENNIDMNDPDEPYGDLLYFSWLDNVLNNDFYYEPSDFYDEAWTIVSASKADISNELTKKYGQDAVNEILKKGYSSLV